MNNEVVIKIKVDATEALKDLRRLERHALSLGVRYHFKMFVKQILKYIKSLWQ